MIRPHLRSERGFSLPEMLISVTLLLVISSIVTSALLQMTNSQRTIWNRTQLHAGVRSATELMQQEVGQAGRIALPGTVSLSANVAAGATTATLTTTAAAPLTAVSGIFPGELLIIDPGSWNQVTNTTLEETVVVASTYVPGTNPITISKTVDATGATIQASFLNAHLAGAKVSVLGGFASGIVPPASSGFTNGSDGTHLKMYGDINGDGSMLYVEYVCDTASGNLYRNVMPFDQTTAKVAPTASQVLLSNITTNPGGTACFTYMPSPLPTIYNSVTLVTDTYVLDVAITLTVNTQLIDPITRAVQTETKALLNVSPRNVFNVWELASAGEFSRVQPIPATVAALLP
jgi:prepilin-type N-terminal cleavage/methylation domain-containing protein